MPEMPLLLAPCSLFQIEIYVKTLAMILSVEDDMYSNL